MIEFLDHIEVDYINFLKDLSLVETVLFPRDDQIKLLLFATTSGPDG